MEVTYEVGQLANEVARALGRAFPDQIWVKGQIRNLSRAQSGHVYFSLIDAESATDSGAAQLPVTLFSSDKDAVNRALVKAGAGRMDDGVEVRIRGYVQHFPSRGVVQLRMTWIDLAFTLGKLAADKAALLKRLQQGGHLDRNRAIPLPLLPLNVGLVSSLGSAAHADFMETLRSSGWAFRVSEVDTRVQGAQAPGSIVRSVAALQGLVDVIAVVRGGGSALDLSAFDAENVALAIAISQLPVITGIGHEIDSPVAGEVAHFAAKTPTAAAQFLVDRVAETARHVEQAATTVADRAGRALTMAGRSLDAKATSAARAVRLQLRGAATTLDRSVARLTTNAALGLGRRSEALEMRGARIGSAAERVLTDGTRRVDAIEARVAALDPKRLLDRGWSVTRTEAGDVVRDPEEASAGDRLHTTVSGGSIISRVEESE